MSRNKTMLARVTSILALLLPVVVGAQYAIPPQIRARNAVDAIAKGGLNDVSNVIYGLPAPPGVTLGDNYLDPKWNVGTVMLSTDDMIERYAMRYDLKSQSLEIRTQSAIKLLDVKKVKSLVWIDSATSAPHYFINAASFKLGDVPLMGLLEVLSDGSIPLLRRATLHLKPADYNPALDVGSRDATIYKKYALYYSVNGSLSEAKGKKLLEAFGDKKTEVEVYMKQKNLGTRADHDILRVFDYYNSIVAKME